MIEDQGSDCGTRAVRFDQEGIHWVMGAVLPGFLLLFQFSFSAGSVAQEAQGSASSPSSPLRFSHALHLTKAGMDCENCHTGIRASKSADDDNLPEESTCLLCHQAEGDESCVLCHPGPGKPGPLARPIRRIRFDHSRHLQMDDLGQEIVSALEKGTYPKANCDDLLPLINPEVVCTACHRGMDRVELSKSQILPQMADCLVCHHSETNPMQDCGICHTEKLPPLPASHQEPSFFDSHSSQEAAHDVAECRQCHSPRYNPCTQCH